MKTNAIYYVLLQGMLAVCLLSSCKEDKEETIAPQQIPVVLKASIYELEATEGTVWRGGQEFGVFMLKAGTDQPVGTYANCLYTADNYSSTGYLIPEDEKPMYYPADGSKVDIVAYYPYEANLTVSRASGYTVEFDLSDQKKVKADDFIHSKEGQGLHGGSGSYELQLRPVLSKIRLDLMPGSGMSEEQLKQLKVSLKEMPTTGVFDLVHGVFLSLDEKKDMEMVKSSTHTTGREMVVFPGQMEESLTLRVELEDEDGNDKEWEIPLKDVISHAEGNTQYEVGLKVNPESLEATLVSTTPIYILDWQDDKENVEDEIEVGGVINLVKDGKLDELSKDKFPIVKAIPNTPNVWFGMDKDEKGTFDMFREQKQGNVLNMNFTGSLTWYKNYIGYTGTQAEAAPYQLTFKAKSNKAGAKLQTLVNINKSGSHFFVLKDADTTKPCAAKVFALTTEWTTYVVDFDFAQTVNTMYSEGITITPSTETDRNAFVLAFIVQEAGIDYSIDDVTLIKQENK